MAAAGGGICGAQRDGQRGGPGGEHDPVHAEALPGDGGRPGIPDAGGHGHWRIERLQLLRDQGGRLDDQAGGEQDAGPGGAGHRPDEPGDGNPHHCQILQPILRASAAAAGEQRDDRDQPQHGVRAARRADGLLRSGHGQEPADRAGLGADLFCQSGVGEEDQAGGDGGGAGGGEIRQRDAGYDGGGDVAVPAVSDGAVWQRDAGGGCGQ